MSNKLTFLGTGTSTGVPQIGCQCDVCQSVDKRDKRTRCSSFIEYEGAKLLIDCGPDFRFQAIENKVYHADAVLFTHHHIDHIGGTDDLRPLKDTDIYLNELTEENVRRMYSYCFEEHPYPGVPKLTLHRIDYNPFTISYGEGKSKSLRIVPIKVMHGKCPIMGYRIGNLAYLTDISYLPEEEYDKLNGLDVLCLGCLRIEPHNTHQSFDEAMKMAERIGAKKTYFIHMSHHIGLHRDIEKMVPGNIEFAYDGLQIEF